MIWSFWARPKVAAFNVLTFFLLHKIKKIKKTFAISSEMLRQTSNRIVEELKMKLEFYLFCFWFPESFFPVKISPAAIARFQQQHRFWHRIRSEEGQRRNIDNFEIIFENKQGNWGGLWRLGKGFIMGLLCRPIKCYTYGPI